jgi:hypothetical protein
VIRREFQKWTGRQKAMIAGGLAFSLASSWGIGLAAAAAAPYQPPNDHTTAIILGTAGAITGTGTLLGLAGLAFWLLNTSSHAEVE